MSAGPPTDHFSAALDALSIRGRGRVNRLFDGGDRQRFCCLLLRSRRSGLNRRLDRGPPARANPTDDRAVGALTGFGRVFEVPIENVDIEILGGFKECTAKDAARNVPENGRGYPENRMFGVLPAYGFFIRHVKGLTMKNVHVTIKQKDARPAILLDDVHNSQLSVTAKGVTDTPTFVKKPE